MWSDKYPLLPSCLPGLRFLTASKTSQIQIFYLKRITLQLYVGMMFVARSITVVRYARD